MKLKNVGMSHIIKQSNTKVLLLLCSLPISYAGLSKEVAKPNIILLMADDLGWGDVGFNGNKIVKTHCMDRLASEGAVFEQFYAAAPLSSPTRASVMTGRNAFRMGVFSANVGILRPEEKVLPEILKENGYTTGHFGKWHLGTLTDKEIDANRGRPENKHLLNSPSEHGYDDAFVTESKVPTYDPMIAPITNNGRFWDYISEQEKKKSYGTYYWDINGEKVTEGLRGDDSRVIIDRVLLFIDNSLQQEKPFLATVWFHTPHLPCVAGPEYKAMYEGMTLEERNYYGCITAMDDQIDRLIQFLKLKGVYENTIILFCSDNGPELNTPGSAGAHRGKKRSLYEGGIKVPAFMVWGNSNLPKQVKQPCSTSDYLPTILKIAGIKDADLYDLDGESFLKFFHSDDVNRNNPLVFCSDTQGAVVTTNYKLYSDKGNIEFYNLRDDPEEKNNISSSHPDKVNELSTYLYRQMDAYKCSFEGGEYGKESVSRMNQNWHNIFEMKE